MVGLLAERSQGAVVHSENGWRHSCAPSTANSGRTGDAAGRCECCSGYIMSGAVDRETAWRHAFDTRVARTIYLGKQLTSAYGQIPLASTPQSRLEQRRD